MPDFLVALAKAIDRINERVGEWASWLNIVLVLLVCVDVFNRYVLNYTAAWVAEMEWHLFALIFLLGAWFAWKHDRHVRVDLFYTHFKPTDKALTDILGTLFFLLPWSFTLMVVSWRYAWKSFLIREASPDPGGIPALYWIKFAISLGMLLLFLQGIARLVHNLQAWKAGRENASN